MNPRFVLLIGFFRPVTKMRVESLRPEHDRSRFDCGKSALNDFFQRHALVNHNLGVSRVYVACQDSEPFPLGYYASSAGSFLREQLPLDDRGGLPRYPLPTAHLGRLAVDLAHQGKRLGERLLFHFLNTACEVSERIGIFAVDLFAKDEDAKRFYLKFGFIPLQDNPFHLYLPVATVRSMFTPSRENPS